MGLLKINLVIILISLLGLSFGSVQADEDAPPFHIQQVDPSFDSQKMAGPGVKVHGAEEFGNEGSWNLPGPKLRDELFEKAGLKKNVQDLDALDRDVLYATAQNSSADRLVKTYPKLPKDRLLALSKLAKAAYDATNKKLKNGDEK
jgi:hypothetical protein